MCMNEWMNAQRHPRSAIGCQKKVNAWNGYIIKNLKVLKNSVKSCAINKISQLQICVWMHACVCIYYIIIHKDGDIWPNVWSDFENVFCFSFFFV